jgi:two-component system, OmpR family, sensor histidine kinase QseC
MTSYSLRRRLQALLVLAVGGVWIGVAATTFFDARRELNALLDAHLAQSAQLLIAQTGHELMEVDTPNLGEVFPYGQKVAFQVWAAGRTLVLRSSEAPPTRFSLIETGLSETQNVGRHWRVYSGWDRDHSVLVQVAEDRATRDRLAARIALNAMVPLLIGLPLLAVLISWIVTRALLPLVGLSNEVGRRQPSTLLPIDVAGIPEEAAPLVARLNDLFDRARRSLEAERRFTANAAHELRNPLAALRAQAEVAAASSSAHVSKAALGHVITSCDRLTRLVEQLLLLARVEETAYVFSECRLDLIARKVLSEAAPEAISNGASVRLEASEPEPVQGNFDLLEIMIRNLVSNAIQHGGPRVEVVVTVHSTPQTVVLTVADNGPGVDAVTRANLGQRFYRSDQTRTFGSGLGLSLVQRIAELHQGAVQFLDADSGSGLQVRVTVPRAQAL